jgi:putative DNA primase/helicase
MAVARELVRAEFIHGETVTLRAWRGGFRAWNQAYWPEVDEATVRAAAYGFLEHALFEHGDELRPWSPTKAKVANVIEALKAATHLPPTVQTPAWLDGDGPNPHDLVVTANGILHVPSGDLRAHDPRLFVGHAVPFAYDPDAPAPTRWHDFLHDLWPDDQSSRTLLQEMFGFAVSGDTRLQKIMLLVGPTRAGKGVVANVRAVRRLGDDADRGGAARPTLPRDRDRPPLCPGHDRTLAGLQWRRAEEARWLIRADTMAGSWVTALPSGRSQPCT